MRNLKPKSTRSDVNKRYYEKQRHKRKLQSKSADERKIPWAGRLPETLIGRIQRVVNEGIATGRYPWKNTTEAVTSLIQRGFLSLKDDPFISEMLPHIEMSQHLDRISVIRREAQTIVAKARQEITELLGIGEKESAVAYYHVTMDAAHKMPPTVWRDWLIKEIRKAFPELAREKPKGVSLSSKKQRN